MYVCMYVCRRATHQVVVVSAAAERRPRLADVQVLLHGKGIRATMQVYVCMYTYMYVCVCVVWGAHGEGVPMLRLHSLR